MATNPELKEQNDQLADTIKQLQERLAQMEAQLARAPKVEATAVNVPEYDDGTIGRNRDEQPCFGVYEVGHRENRSPGAPPVLQPKRVNAFDESDATALFCQYYGVGASTYLYHWKVIVLQKATFPERKSSSERMTEGSYPVNPATLPKQPEPVTIGD